MLARAREAGLHCFINPSTDISSSKRAIALAEAQDDIYVAVGYHPYDASDLTSKTLSELQQLANHAKVIAIGEIGLDYYRDITPKADQIWAFEEQLSLAKLLNLPVIVHQRDAIADMMTILRQWGSSNHPGLVLHTFSGDQAMLIEALDLGFHIGIGGPVTFKNARGLPDLVATIPSDRLLLETDSPYLSPHPYRGKRNEPARLPLIAEKIAQILDLDYNTLAQQTTRNTEKLFYLLNREQEVGNNFNDNF